MYPFGPDYGDVMATPAVDDFFYGPVTFPNNNDFIFFGKNYSKMFVGSNGYVTMDAGSSSFVAQSFPLQGSYKSLAVIAPWWSDVDTSNGTYAIQGYSQLVNSIYYRSGTAASDIARVTQAR